MGGRLGLIDLKDWLSCVPLLPPLALVTLLSRMIGVKEGMMTCGSGRARQHVRPSGARCHVGWGFSGFFIKPE